MRGEHYSGTFDLSNGTGIIPACAGSTVLLSRLIAASPGSSPHARGARARFGVGGQQLRDHPRMRGEHKAKSGWRIRMEGIIPACAGSTRTGRTFVLMSLGSSPHARGARMVPSTRKGFWWDHPRMRGEHAREAAGERRGAGIIPACAGSTQSTHGIPALK